MMGSEWVRVASVNDVRTADGQLRRSLAGVTLAVFEVEGAFHVTQDLCTHGEASLAEGYLEGFIIECPFHQGMFDIRTGSVEGPPCTQPIRVFEVEVDGDDILISRAAIEDFRNMPGAK